MSYTAQTFIVHVRPQVRDDLQKSNKIESYENLVIEESKRAAKGMVFGIIFSIPIWILIIDFIIWVIP